MHREIVPAEEEPAGPEGPVRLLPAIERVLEDRLSERCQLAEPAPQQREQVETLGIVVELVPIDRQARCSREGPGPALLVEQVPLVVTNAAHDSIRTARIAREHLNLCQGL